jgi:hypothetical protein
MHPSSALIDKMSNSFNRYFGLVTGGYIIAKPAVCIEPRRIVCLAGQKAAGPGFGAGVTGPFHALN